MHFKYNIQFQKVGNTYIGVAVGKDKSLFSDYLALNETGYAIASLIKDEKTRNEIIDILLESYEAEQQMIEECVDDIITYFKEKGVLWTE